MHADLQETRIYLYINCDILTELPGIGHHSPWFIPQMERLLQQHSVVHAVYVEPHTTIVTVSQKRRQ